ncbi:MAG: hypothetical protein ACOYBP_00580 [Microbacteriaceae bacterium]
MRAWGVIGLIGVLALTGCASEMRNSAVDTLDQSDDLKAIAAEFDAGTIVSDQQFYDALALTEPGIQSFLDNVPCTPKDTSPCLADFKTKLPSIAADDSEPGHCDAIEGRSKATAATIIARIAVACGVSPKLLLVLMQKEQSLLTKPSEYGYQRATGYGCPDTTGCDAKYYGFVNQVYNAAWQFRQYTVQPDRKYHIGTVDIDYNPEPSCGSSDVKITNQATANLYNYTPYQPNAAAIADPAGEGNDCSAWGNLNVWLLWNVWFGDPLQESLPGYLPNCVTHENGARCEIYDPISPFIQ